MNMETLEQKEFLEQTPPGSNVCVSDFEAIDRQAHTRIRTPEIELHCSICGGQRFFAATDTGAYIGERKPVDSFLDYICRNRRRCVKTFAIGAHYEQEEKRWLVFKYGEERAI